MNVQTVAAMIREARAVAPVATWPGYAIGDVPFAVYDTEAVTYIGHPNPPLDRPEGLMAATSVAINGVETATIPVQICPDAQATVPLAYHEGFHVYQHHHFAPLEADFFLAMAYYPDLDAEFRALCRLEVATLCREDLTAAQKMPILGELIRLRRERLTGHASLLAYERLLERSEGTAFYVEQRARQALFGIDPVLGDVGHGWARFYHVGAALCWLLDSSLPGWTTQVEKGASPGDLLLAHADATLDLGQLGYAAILAQEEAALGDFRRKITADLEKLARPDVQRLIYRGANPVYRGFSPVTLVSLGDGRVLHRTHFNLLLPGCGQIAIKDQPVIDHVRDGELILGAAPLELRDGHLHAKTPTVEIDLTGVTLNADGGYVLSVDGGAK